MYLSTYLVPERVLYIPGLVCAVLQLPPERRDLLLQVLYNQPETPVLTPQLFVALLKPIYRTEDNQMTTVHLN